MAETNKIVDLNALTYYNKKRNEITDNKVDKIDGKELSSNDFTDALKSKLESMTNPILIKGTVESVDSLPTNAEVGWFYFVGAQSASTFDEYIYTASGTWEFIGVSEEGVDLANYYMIDEVDELLDDKLDDTTTYAASDSVAGSALKAIADENGVNIADSISAIKSTAAINKTTLGTERKNLLQVTASTKTQNGITFTVNDDGSITANGTCTAPMAVFAGIVSTQSGVKYTLSGCPSGGGISSYGLTARRAEDESIDKADDWGEGKTFTGDGYKYNIRMRIAKGAVLDNIVFYPMVRYADITDDTFEPYKPSVNDRVSALEESTIDKIDSSTFSAHTNNNENPHNVTKEQLNLGNVDNTADSTKKVLQATNDKNGNDISETYLPLSGGVMNNNSEITIGSANDARKMKYGYSMKFLAPSGGWVSGINYYNNDESEKTAGIGVYHASTTTADLDYYYMGADYNNPLFKLLPSGSAVFTGSVTANSFLGNATSSSNCTGNSATATKLATAVNVNGMTIDGSTARTNYGTCSTTAATQAKEVSITGFELKTGAEVAVRFTYTNSAIQATLNVNSTGAKSIYYNNALLNSTTAGYLKAFHVYTFRYDGTGWVLTGTHNYTDTKVTQTNTDDSNSYRLLFSGNANDTTQTSTVRKSTNFQVIPDRGVLKVGSIQSTNAGEIFYKGLLSLVANVHLEIPITNLSDYSVLSWVYSTSIVGGESTFGVIPIQTIINGEVYNQFIDNTDYYHFSLLSGSTDTLEFWSSKNLQGTFSIYALI